MVAATKCSIAQHFGRPSTPTDQAWIETLWGHVKYEYPHMMTITDPGIMAAELERIRIIYNTVRLHEAIGYVTPNDEHTGHGATIRAAPADGLRIADDQRRATTEPTGPGHYHHHRQPVDNRPTLSESDHDLSALSQKRLNHDRGDLDDATTNASAAPRTRLKRSHARSGLVLTARIAAAEQNDAQQQRAGTGRAPRSQQQP